MPPPDRLRPTSLREVARGVRNGSRCLNAFADLMLPRPLSIAALMLVTRRAACPQALMKAYLKGER